MTRRPEVKATLWLLAIVAASTVWIAAFVLYPIAVLAGWALLVLALLWSMLVRHFREEVESEWDE